MGWKVVMTNRAVNRYLLLGIAFNVIALLLPLSRVATPSHNHWLVTSVIGAAALFNALAVHQLWIKRHR